MPSTVINRIVAAILCAGSATAGAAMSDTPPRFLTVPVLGLRLPIAHTTVEPFPEALRVRCWQLEDDIATSRVWVFGHAKDAERTYYVLTGYFKRFHPLPDQKRYEFWDNGGVFTVTSAKCGGDDAEETFDVHDPRAPDDGNVPIPMLKALAIDLAERTVKAFGGADRLRAEIKRQRIEFKRLSPELQDAFKPYFAPAK
jgi:hypothetical protein